MVTLTAGVTWLGAGAAAADQCHDRSATVRAQRMVTALCDDATRLRVDDPSGTGEVIKSETSRLAHSAARLAERIGLTGLGSVRALGLSDLGGVAATSSMPALSNGVPLAGGLPDLGRLPEVPDLPNLPTIPGVRNLPVGATVGKLPDPAKVAAEGLKAPLNLPQPVNELKDDLINKMLPQVPAAVGGINDATRLPDAQTSLTDLLETLDLG
ncbi:hypothetical protein [Nonomuraea sp. SBT364]|uniref:hypothetical protein n=1 Tax=Nonomuraea sp. SBT364 TaxID=1580530 RepID=UPI00066D3117|nr:hypothetical protein [Nonomuraea sp. SBT364]